MVEQNHLFEVKVCCFSAEKTISGIVLERFLQIPADADGKRNWVMTKEQFNDYQKMLQTKADELRTQWPPHKGCWRSFVRVPGNEFDYSRGCEDCTHVIEFKDEYHHHAGIRDAPFYEFSFGNHIGTSDNKTLTPDDCISCKTCKRLLPFDTEEHRAETEEHIKYVVEFINKMNYDKYIDNSPCCIRYSYY